MGVCIGIKTRTPVMAKDIEEAAVRHGALPLEKADTDAGVPSDRDPIIEEIVLRLHDMDDEDKRDILRKAMKLRNAQHIR